jgi:hypothetical protein
MLSSKCGSVRRSRNVHLPLLASRRVLGVAHCSLSPTVAHCSPLFSIVPGYLLMYVIVLPYRSRKQEKMKCHSFKNRMSIRPLFLSPTIVVAHSPTVVAHCSYRPLFLPPTVFVTHCSCCSLAHRCRPLFLCPIVLAAHSPLL